MFHSYLVVLFASFKFIFASDLSPDRQPQAPKGSGLGDEGRLKKGIKAANLYHAANVIMTGTPQFAAWIGALGDPRRETAGGQPPRTKNERKPNPQDARAVLETVANQAYTTYETNMKGRADHFNRARKVAKEFPKWPDRPTDEQLLAWAKERGKGKDAWDTANQAGKINHQISATIKGIKPTHKPRFNDYKRWGYEPAPPDLQRLPLPSDFSYLSFWAGPCGRMNQPPPKSSRTQSTIGPHLSAWEDWTAWEKAPWGVDLPEGDPKWPTGYSTPSSLRSRVRKATHWWSPIPESSRSPLGRNVRKFWQGDHLSTSKRGSHSSTSKESSRKSQSRVVSSDKRQSPSLQGKESPRRLQSLPNSRSSRAVSDSQSLGEAKQSRKRSSLTASRIPKTPTGASQQTPSRESARGSRLPKMPQNRQMPQDDRAAKRSQPHQTQESMHVPKGGQAAKGSQTAKASKRAQLPKGRRREAKGAKQRTKWS